MPSRWLCASWAFLLLAAAFVPAAVLADSARVMPSDFGGTGGVTKILPSDRAPLSGTDIKNLTTLETFATIQDAIDDVIRNKADGTLVEHCSFTHAHGTPGSYDGRGIASIEDITVRGCNFADMRRIGVHLFGSGVVDAVVENCIYTGKGAGDWLDYGVELGGGAHATLRDNTITSCTGVALTDGSTSAAVLITDFYAPGTMGTLTGNFLSGNTAGIVCGYLTTDASVVTAAENDLSANDYGTINPNPAKTSNASANWWGTADAATVAAAAGTDVDYSPWLQVGRYVQCLRCSHQLRSRRPDLLADVAPLPAGRQLHAFGLQQHLPSLQRRWRQPEHHAFPPLSGTVAAWPRYPLQPPVPHLAGTAECTGHGASHPVLRWRSLRGSGSSH